MQNFEKLPIYRESLDLVDLVYKIAKKFPKDEQFCFIDQIRKIISMACKRIFEVIATFGLVRHGGLAFAVRLKIVCCAS